MSFTSETPQSDEMDASPGITIRLKSPSAGSCMGEMLELHALEALVRLAPAEVRSLAVGATVTLEVKMAGIVRPLEASVRVIRRAETADGGRVYGLRLPEVGSVGGSVTAHLTSQFNRRSTFRVRPLPLTQVSVRVAPQDGGPPAIASLADISLGGLGLRVSPSVERRLRRVDLVELSFRLPDSEDIDLLARIRSRQLSGRQIRYGLKFETKGEAWPSGKREVVSYVTRRQAEELRQARERSLS